MKAATRRSINGPGARAAGDELVARHWAVTLRRSTPAAGTDQSPIAEAVADADAELLARLEAEASLGPPAGA